MCDLQNPIFTNDNAAREHLESLHWPMGPVCPHCKTVDKATLMQGKTTRAGLYKCNECRKPFSVTVGTIFERSHIPLSKWLLATHLMAASKKGVSSHQLHRMLGVTYKTAWFMSHRIREAMRPTDSGKVGGNGGIVEVDETFIGHVKEGKGRKGYGYKEKVFSLLERETGKVRSQHVARVNAATLLPILKQQIAAEATIFTDEAGQYTYLYKHFDDHHVVTHSIGEYVRGSIHTNTIEGYFSIFKRGMNGVYQHCKPKHLKRYLAEFDFRYNERKIEDGSRAAKMLQGARDRRLTYRPVVA